MLSIARRLPQADKFVRNSDWVEGPFPLSSKMSGARLGLIGMGRIGQAIAKRAAAFDMSIAYTSRNKAPGVSYNYFPSAKELAANVDYLVVITPGGAATKHLVNAEVLAALGPKGYLINVARGRHLVDQDLIDLLDNGHMAGATLDVFRTEPLPPSHAFWQHPQITVTPHTSARTLRDESIAQITGKIKALERGEEIWGRVDLVRGY